MDEAPTRRDLWRGQHTDPYRSKLEAVSMTRGIVTQVAKKKSYFSAKAHTSM